MSSNKPSHSNTVQQDTGTLAAPLNLVFTPIDALVPDPANPRRISNSELEKLTRSIQEFGFVDPVIARKADNRVIGGHARLLASRKLGYTEVPVIFLDLDVERARLMNVALNNIGGEFDQELLARLLAQIQAGESGADLSLTGFDDSELKQLLDSIEHRELRSRPETFDVVQALADSSGTTTRPGDEWILGSHRLICGDATSKEAVSRLTAGTPASMAFTDPPYNVDYRGGAATRSVPRRKIANDAMPKERWREFCHAWASNLVDSVDGALYVCMSAREWPVVASVLEEVEGHWSTTLIWAKNHFTLGRSDYQRGYEPIWYGWSGASKRQWHGGRNQSDLWQLDRPAASSAHPTMKPLGLVERAIENSSKPGDRVLDLFTGSGTTLIACEHTGRSFLGLELDPHYVDVAVARWEAFTGKKARLARGEDPA